MFFVSFIILSMAMMGIFVTSDVTGNDGCSVVQRLILIAQSVKLSALSRGVSQNFGSCFTVVIKLSSFSLIKMVILDNIQ